MAFRIAVPVFGGAYVGSDQLSFFLNWNRLMHCPLRVPLFAVIFFCMLSDLAIAKPNVLLIAVDDMNDWVGCLQGHPDARSPNIDRLASRGVLFSNAHCQAPICNPSRVSIMFGLRPSTSGVYQNSPSPWSVASLKGKPTMPRYFGQHGYATYTTGKIYHGSGLRPGEFQHVGPRPGQRLKIDARLVRESKQKGAARGLWDFGPQSYPEDQFADHQTASWAIESLQNHHHQHPDKPFFMAIGFYRPHVPLYSPQRVFDEIPTDEIELPVVKLDDRDDLPQIVDTLTVPPVAPTHRWFVDSGRWQEAVQSYLACIRWTDEQIGRLLDALDDSPHADNTIVVLFSDHGFFLGEKQRWAKQSLWERATRVPFVIRAPGLSSGVRCSRPAELLSIFPTLIDLCDMTPLDGLEGVSLRPLLADAEADWPHMAVTTFGQHNHAVRTETHRYIRYQDGSEELYDLRADPHEWNNIADVAANRPLIEKLATYFPNVNVPDAKRVKSPKAK